MDVSFAVELVPDNFLTVLSTDCLPHDEIVESYSRGFIQRDIRSVDISCFQEAHALVTNQELCGFEIGILIDIPFTLKSSNLLNTHPASKARRHEAGQSLNNVTNLNTGNNPVTGCPSGCREDQV